MRVTVLVGSDRLRVPVDEGSKTMSWLQAEIVRRWERSHPGEFLRISELRTADNVRLDNEDQVFEVCREDESLIAVLGTGTEKEVGPGDMVKQYYLMNLIGEGTFGRGETNTQRSLTRRRLFAAGTQSRTRGATICRDVRCGSIGNLLCALFKFAASALLIICPCNASCPLMRLLSVQSARSEPEPLRGRQGFAS